MTAPAPRSRVAFRLFLAFALVAGLGAAVAWIVADVAANASFRGHLGPMAQRMGMGHSPRFARELLEGFTNSLNTAVALGGVTAFAAAVAVSAWLARRITAPVDAMMRISARIADGHYAERVPVTGDDELGALAAQFNRMAEALAQTEQRRRDLIADVAHELRTPLSAIAGYLEGIIDGVVPATPETHHRIARETARLQRLVGDLSELSRAEAGQLVIRPRALDARELVDAAVARFQSQFDDKGVTLRSAPAPAPLRVRADPDRIGQVLTNVLGNALQYTQPGGHVEVSARPAAAGVEFVVADTGVGIAPEHLPHVFDRFYRADRSRARVTGGSGIGLTIARSLVQAHGGRIQAASEGDGRGSTFSFTLPPA